MSFKSKLIETEKARVLIVDLPEGATGAEVYNKEGLRTAILVYDASGMPTPYPIDNLPLGSTWLPAGKIGEVPEEVAAKMVESFERLFPERHVCYVNYLHPIERGNHLFKKIEQKWTDPFSTATQSLRSLIAANVKLQNPLGNECPEDVDDLGAFTQHRRKQILTWRAEEETVCRNAFLFYEII